jgi:hypothetical protein
MPTAKIRQATSSVVPKCLLRCSTVEVCSYVGEMSLSWIRSVDWPLKVRKSTVSCFHRFSLGETCWDHVENAYWVGLKSSYLVLHWTDVIKVFELWLWFRSALQYGFSAHAEYCHNVMKFICEQLPLHCICSRRSNCSSKGILMFICLLMPLRYFQSNGCFYVNLILVVNPRSLCVSNWCTSALCLFILLSFTFAPFHSAVRP